MVRLVAELDVSGCADDIDIHEHEVLWCDDTGNVWGSTPAVLRHFQISGQRLTIIAGRRDFPEHAKQSLNGRVFWNMSEIERYLLSVRRLSGPLPRYVVNLLAAGKLTHEKGRLAIAA
ncbi:MAG: hypothetical protein AB7O71_10740 [Hyphomicrobiaceae bacterium]